MPKFSAMSAVPPSGPTSSLWRVPGLLASVSRSQPDIGRVVSELVAELPGGLLPLGLRTGQGAEIWVGSGPRSYGMCSIDPLSICVYIQI